MPVESRRLNFKFKSIIQVSHELSEASISVAFAILQTIFDSLNLLGVNPSYIGDVTSAINSLLTYSKYYYAADRRRLAQSSDLETEKQLVMQYASMLINSVIYGQSNLVFIQSEFRLVVSSSLTFGGLVTVATPATDFEAAVSGTVPISSSLKVNSSYSDIAIVSMIEFNAINLGISGLTSNIIALTINNFNICATNRECLFALDMGLYSSVEYIDAPVEKFNVSCAHGSFVSYQYDCRNGTVQNVSCRGIAEIITTTCDESKILPVCSRVDSENGLENNSCIVQSFDSNATQCLCKVEMQNANEQFIEFGGRLVGQFIPA